MMISLQVIGKRLQTLRKRRGFKTQKHVAAFAKSNKYILDWRRYGAIERGDIKPDIEEIFAICVILGISADEWIFGHKPKQIKKIHLLTEKEIEAVNTIVAALLKLDAT